MEEISLNGGEGFQEASWGVGNVFKKFEEYTLGWVDLTFLSQNQAARVIPDVKFRADSENHHEKII